LSGKSSRAKDEDVQTGLWISPRLEVNRTRSSNENLDAATGARFLELADIALGQRKHHKYQNPPHDALPTLTKKKPVAEKKSGNGAATGAPRNVCGR
jgi:hypothetical protein